jgi:hypothetical protein
MLEQAQAFHSALTPKHKSSVDWLSRAIPKTKKGKIELAREIIDDCPTGHILDDGALEIFNNLCQQEASSIWRHLGLDPVFRQPRTMQRLEDGEWIPRSWRTMIGVNPRNASLDGAMRLAVRKQTASFLDKAIREGAVCVFCGSAENLNADHDKVPFRDLKASFIAIYGEPSLIDGAHQVGAVIAQPHRNLWREYHQHNATLQVLCRSCNARKG